MGFGGGSGAGGKGLGRGRAKDVKKGKSNQSGGVFDRWFSGGGVDMKTATAMATTGRGGAKAGSDQSVEGKEAGSDRVLMTIELELMKKQEERDRAEEETKREKDKKKERGGDGGKRGEEKGAWFESWRRGLSVETPSTSGSILPQFFSQVLPR